jgi:hypothetical protein
VLVYVIAEVTVLGFSTVAVMGMTIVFVVTYVVGFSPTLVFVARTATRSIVKDRS